VFHSSHEVRHDRLSDAGARLFHVEFAPRCLEQMRAEGELLGDSVVRQVGPVVRLAQNLYREFCQTDSASTFAIEGLTLEIVGALLRAAPRADSTSASRVPRWLVRVREQLDDEPSRHHSVQAIAVDAGVSPVRLSRAFRRTYGESLGSYQRRVRIRRACERLRDEETTLAAIALDAGFTDQSHFTRVFTRLIGITPAVFRREQRRSTTW